MNRATILKHEFVETIPATLQDGTIYVSIPFATAVHKCCCGCGSEVVTPITPTDWQLTYDGETVSLHPSIGNWNLPCEAHYFIRRNTVQWARRWSREEIAAGRAHEQDAKDEYFNTPTKEERAATPKKGKGGRGLWRKLKKRFS
jgi:Family of unknown function (DUF6527)